MRQVGGGKKEYYLSGGGAEDADVKLSQYWNSRTTGSYRVYLSQSSSAILWLVQFLLKMIIYYNSIFILIYGDGWEADPFYDDRLKLMIDLESCNFIVNPRLMDFSNEERCINYDKNQITWIMMLWKIL